METEVKLLETQVYSQLLKQSAEKGSIEEIQELWAEIPAHIKRMQGISAIYFAAMIDVGAGAIIEQDLADVLSVNWDETLLVLFGSVQSLDAPRQLETAEQWLPAHQDSAVLLAVLGKLSSICQDVQKAESYLYKSIAAEPTVQAYQLLGDLLFTKGDKDKASQCYKNGLELASSEVVSRIDAVS